MLNSIALIFIKEEVGGMAYFLKYLLSYEHSNEGQNWKCFISCLNCLIVVIDTLSCCLNAELAKLWWPLAIVQGVTSNQGTGNQPDKQNM